jgi:hypothetical protein
MLTNQALKHATQASTDLTTNLCTNWAAEHATNDTTDHSTYTAEKSIGIF